MRAVEPNLAEFARLELECAEPVGCGNEELAADESQTVDVGREERRGLTGGQIVVPPAGGGPVAPQPVALCGKPERTVSAVFFDVHGQGSQAAHEPESIALRVVSVDALHGGSPQLVAHIHVEGIAAARRGGEAVGFERASACVQPDDALAVRAHPELVAVGP